MKTFKKLIPYIAVLLFSLIFAFLQIIPSFNGLTVPLLQETKPIQQQDANILDINNYSCAESITYYLGFPFRINGYEYCGDGGIIFIPVAINILLYLVMSYYLYNFTKKAIKN